jgi:hypothetical protein
MIKKDNLDDARSYFESLLLDDYTKNLYAACYNWKLEEVTVEKILRYALEMFITKKIPAYINLNEKRVMFMELLLSPLFKAVGRLAQQAAIGYKVDEMKMDKYSIVKYFLKNKDKNNKSMDASGLSGNYVYNIVNLMSSIMVHKVCFKNPGSDNPPSTISRLHKSHFEKICPVTVSNENPGETLSILPDVYLDYFGQFSA